MKLVLSVIAYYNKFLLNTPPTWTPQNKLLSLSYELQKSEVVTLNEM